MCVESCLCVLAVLSVCFVVLIVLVFNAWAVCALYCQDLLLAEGVHRRSALLAYVLLTSCVFERILNRCALTYHALCFHHRSQNVFTLAHAFLHASVCAAWLPHDRLCLT